MWTDTWFMSHYVSGSVMFYFYCVAQPFLKRVLFSQLILFSGLCWSLYHLVRLSLFISSEFLLFSPQLVQFRVKSGLQLTFLVSESEKICLMTKVFLVGSVPGITLQAGWDLLTQLTLSTKLQVTWKMCIGAVFCIVPMALEENFLHVSLFLLLERM